VVARELPQVVEKRLVRDGSSRRLDV
jgi:hypothetical protein